MKKTLFKQFFYIYIILSLFLLGTICIYFLQYLHTEKFIASQQKTTLVWKILSTDVFDNIYSLNNPTLNQRLIAMSAYLHATIRIYDNKDRIMVRYENGYLDESEYEQTDTERLILLQIKTPIISDEGKHFLVKDSFVSSYSIYKSREVLGYFVVIQDKDTLLLAWDELLGDLLLLSCLIFTIALIIYILYVKRLVNPILHLTKVASLINVKNMDIPIIDSSQNEIGELAHQFRQMSKNLKTSFEEINSQKEMLLSIINFVHQAIWIVDENAKIIMTNAHLCSIMQIADPIGEPLFTAMRNPDIIKIYQDTVAEKMHITREVELQDRLCLCTSSYMTTNKNVIFTLLDVSEIKAVEKMKKDIISNVSHELKTPLTTIKGFVETLIEDANPEAKNYLEIVQRNTDRLILIVNDILTLSKLENSRNIDKQAFSLYDFFGRIDTLFGEVYKGKGARLLLKLAEGLPPIVADEYLLEQAFVNLIDNAVKYGGEGEIVVSAEYDGSCYKLCVADNGAGIPPEHQKRIFERFYVVDKSRSKRMGGTGLGLSIVKHIVNLHGGDVWVESGEGTKFVLVMHNA